jgi:hypothetical protein
MTILKLDDVPRPSRETPWLIQFRCKWLGADRKLESSK